MKKGGCWDVCDIGSVMISERRNEEKSENNNEGLVIPELNWER